jgi:hypothetical protein
VIERFTIRGWSCRTSIIGIGWLLLASPVVAESPAPLVPTIQGEWWTVARSPDLGDLTSPGQEPVDFGMWQAADGTWQLWSCIRKTKEPGNTRLFFRWEGKRLTDPDWKPMGIAMHADPKLGEQPGGLQAPFVFRHKGKYLMFYGDLVNICSAESDDGKKFTRRLNADGVPALFKQSPRKDGRARDPMVIRIGDLWHCYYTAHPDKKGADYCRTSSDLLNWGEQYTVAAGGESTDGPYSAECPFVVETQPGQYYLFRTQSYKGPPTTRVYYSTDPLHFGIDEDAKHLVVKLPVAAPEIIQHDGQYYIAALLPDIKGIRIARLEWVPLKE